MREGGAFGPPDELPGPIAPQLTPERLPSALTQSWPGSPAFYCAKDDYLRLWATATNYPNPANQLVLALRILRPDGRTELLREVFSFAPNNTVTKDIVPGEGWILYAAACLNLFGGVSDPLPSPGQLFVRLDVRRQIQEGPFGLATNTVSTLLAGYLTEFAAVSWPTMRPHGSRDAVGSSVLVTGADPAAGVEWSIIVPLSTVWRVQSVRAILATDATVAARRPRLVIDDQVTPVAVIPLSEDVPASSSADCTWGAGLSMSGAVGNAARLQGLPVELILPQGFRMRSSTTALQAGDNWAAPAVLVEQWATPTGR